jgi:hypothetical protein
MARNNRTEPLSKFALHDVEIGAADAAGAHFEQYVPGLQLRLRYVFDPQRAISDGGWRGKHRSFH